MWKAIEPPKQLYHQNNVHEKILINFFTNFFEPNIISPNFTLILTLNLNPNLILTQPSTETLYSQPLKKQMRNLRMNFPHFRFIFFGIKFFNEEVLTTLKIK